MSLARLLHGGLVILVVETRLGGGSRRQRGLEPLGRVGVGVLLDVRRQGCQIDAMADAPQAVLFDASVAVFIPIRPVSALQIPAVKNATGTNPF